LPGLVLDRYGDTCVLKLYTVAWVAHLAQLLPALIEASGAEVLILRLSRAVADLKALLFGLHPGQRLYGPGADGDANEGAVVGFLENGLRFTADVVHGQKTGFFFDHRHNRARVERLARNCEVLNLFAYTGAFSLYAARGGAHRVLSQDLSAPALVAAQAHFDLNVGDARVAAAAHEVLQGDAFEALASLHKAGESFGLIVVDPPSFAASMDDVPNALRAYQRLARGALRLLRSEGVLVMASCTARVTPQQFYGAVLGSAQAMGVRLQETARTGHALDHPVGFAEGRYLKCLFARRADVS
jgi:23S rRNA (cytosine1962-C5)-methyltransferase